MSADPSLLLVVVSGRNINVIVSDAENDEERWLDNPADPTIVFDRLDAEMTRTLAFSINRARERGASTRFTLRGEPTEITPAGAFVTFRQGGRRRDVSFDAAADLECRLRGAANRSEAVGRFASA